MKERRKQLSTLLMLLPALLLLVVLYVGALITALLQSFGWAPLYGIKTWTLEHYISLVNSTHFWASLGLSLYYALVPSLLCIVASVYLALLLQQAFKGQSFVSFVYKLPLVVPYLVAVALISILWSSGGLIARGSFALDLIDSTRDFPRLLYSRTGIGIMLVYLWKQIPFATLIIYAVLQSLDKSLEGAARTLGANPWQSFWRITLPRLMPGIVAAFAIIFAFNFASFEVPFLLGGEPNTLAVTAWRAFGDADYSRRLSAMATVMFMSLISSGLLILAFWGYRHLRAPT